MTTCKDCNEHLTGDGYTTVMYCPNIPEDSEIHELVEYAAPDEGPFFCGHTE